MRIDAHQHFWRLDRGDYPWLTEDLSGIRRDFLPADLLPKLRQASIGGTVLVQAAATDAETDFLLTLGDDTPWILGVVGWVDLWAEHAGRRIAALATHSKLVGIRATFTGETDEGWFLRPEIAPALEMLISHDLALDALLRTPHLAALRSLARRHPDLRIVVDHGAKPDIAGRAWQPWAGAMVALAGCGNVFCKLSGLATEMAPGQPLEDALPYARQLLECFGADRVMFGSDWPVMRLATRYEDWQRFCEERVLAGNEQHAVMGGTAARVYRLGPVSA